MKRPAALFPIVLALGAIILSPRGGAQAQDAREEGPTEIEKCRTISKPGSYKLVNNLVATSGDCLVITADFVTIDLAGFTISGTTNGLLPAGIRGTSLQGIAVRNGSISGFVEQVNLSASNGSIVEGLRVAGLGQVGNEISATGIVKGNTATNLRGTGISATGR
jgi:hypothetical protein